jgi:hypothetical protein
VGLCTYCGMPAGFFKTKHPECVVEAAVLLETKQAWVGKLWPLVMDEKVDCKALAAECLRVLPRDAKEVAGKAFGWAVGKTVQEKDTSTNKLGAMADFAGAFGIRGADIPGRGWAQFVMLVTSMDLARGVIPHRVDDPGFGIIFDKDEEIVWAFGGTTYLEDKAQRAGGRVYGGVSMRVMQGLYVHAAAPVAQPHVVEGLVEVAEGNLIITNRSIWFQSSHATMKVRLKDIAVLHCFDDGFGYCASRSGSRNKAFKTAKGEGWFANDLVSRLKDML